MTRDEKNEEKTEEELTTFIHDLFLENKFLEWRKGLNKHEAAKWHSLIVGLDNCGAPIDRLQHFGQSIYSKLVFNYVNAPDYSESRMLMIQFTVAGSMWHCLIWHCPERN